MRALTADQWVLIFFFYCLCGWLWESFYVSICQRQWVNRGFLHGPILPIYGFGAVIILLATIQVRENIFLLYLFGAAAATALEYATGAVMEGLFKVRYWDYSEHPYNLNGYICMSSTIGWGFFSVLLVKVIHPPIAGMLLQISPMMATPLTLALTAVFSLDAVQSFRAAMSLREVLVKLTEENEELRRLARRVEIISAFAEEDLQNFRDKTQVERILLKEYVEAERLKHKKARMQRRRWREQCLEEALQASTAAKLKALENITAAMESKRELLENSGELLLEKRAEIDEALDKLRERKKMITNRTAKTFKRSLRILRGNPSAKTKQYAEALESLRGLDGIHHEK